MDLLLIFKSFSFSSYFWKKKTITKRGKLGMGENYFVLLPFPHLLFILSKVFKYDPDIEVGHSTACRTIQVKEQFFPIFLFYPQNYIFQSIKFQTIRYKFKFVYLFKSVCL